MTLNSPVQITSRLLAGVQIGDTEISIGYAGETSDGRTRYEYYIDSEAFNHHAKDLKSGCGGGSLQEGLESLLSFLGAAAESWRYSGKDGENSDLFPEAVCEWAAQNSDEISMLAIELEETEGLIAE